MILVTGATGLLGSHLLYTLVKEHDQVRALYRLKSSINRTREIFSFYEAESADELMSRIEWVKADVLDLVSLEIAFSGVTEVYHCAAKVSFRKRDLEDVMTTNVQGTVNLLSLSQDYGIEKFCHVSSIASFGRNSKGNQIDESSRWDENDEASTYAWSKYLAELEVWRAIEEGLNAVIINPSMIIGSGNWKSGSSAIFNRVWQGLSFYTEGVNGFVDVRDVVKAMIQLMQQNRFNDRYILVSENLSFREVINGISEGLNLKKPRLRANWFLSEFAWRMESIRSWISRSNPVITKESARIALDKQFYSNAKIRKVLQFEFIPIKSSIEVAAKNFLSSAASNSY